MVKKVWVFVVCAALLSPFAALADDTLVRFDGGIGVIPVSSGVPVGSPPANIATDVNRNVVRGIQPPGQLWVIAALKARVKEDGSIKVEGRGLLLGGGNNIGMNANASVFATLICGTAAPFSFHSSDLTGVPLAADGDFEIDDVLDPLPPDLCDNPVLLIRSAGTQSWFAAGILKR